MTHSDTAKVQAKLHEIEDAIISKMAQKTGVTEAKMKVYIESLPELGAYYYKIRDQIIRDYAADAAAAHAANQTTVN